MSGDKIPEDHVAELADCFPVHAPGVFGYARVLACGDRAPAEDLVQPTFVAAAGKWSTVRGLCDAQRASWLYTTVSHLAVSVFRQHDAFRCRLQRLEALYWPPSQVTHDEAVSGIAPDRCWQAIQELPPQQHAVAVMRWLPANDHRRDRHSAAHRGGNGRGAPVGRAGQAESGPGTVRPVRRRGRRIVMTRTGTDAASTREDQLLVRRYRQVTDAQAARYAATYDTGAGLKRFTDWLQEHTAPGTDHFGSAAAAAAIADPDAWPVAVLPTPATARMDAGPAVVQLYAVHQRALVRLAALLVQDIPTAEDVVHDSFIAMRDAWDRLPTTENALAYLRQAVVNRSRSVLRHRTAADRNAQQAPPDMPSAEDDVLIQLERSHVAAALRKLPERQREAIVLQYYTDLSEAEIAAVMGISRGAVKAHTTRGIATLRAAMEQKP